MNMILTNFAEFSISKQGYDLKWASAYLNL